MDNVKYYKLLDAISLAWKVHEGQYRNDGVTPYIYHPLTVMMNVDSYEAKIVAVLHDVVEDHSEFAGLYGSLYGFGVDIFGAVMALTKKEGQSYEDYIEQVRQNSLAREVKVADIKHNLSCMNPDVHNPKQEKYLKALDRLSFNRRVYVK